MLSRLIPLGAAITLAGLLAARWLARPGERADLPPAVLPPGIAGDAFGINEAVSVPGAVVHRLTPTQQRAELAGDAALTRGLGARIVRANSHTFPYLNHQAWKQQDDPWIYADAYMQVLA